MDWSFLIEKQFLKGSLLCDWGSGGAESTTRIHCSLPDPSSSAGMKWIERTRVSDGTPPPERHSICYEVGVLMKCRERLLFFSSFPPSSLLSQALQGRPSVCYTRNGWKEPIEFYTPLVMINVSGVGRRGSVMPWTLGGGQAPLVEAWYLGLGASGGEGRIGDWRYDSSLSSRPLQLLSLVLIENVCSLPLPLVIRLLHGLFLCAVRCPLCVTWQGWL